MAGANRSDLTPEKRRQQLKKQNMKEVKQCSISTIAFTLEVDAYDTLYTYINSIRQHYDDNADGEEIIADIEARVAELILSTHPADRVVSKALIDNIIRQMGSAEDICDESSSAEPQEEPKKRKSHKRRLYRNIDDAPIGGVCSGVAAYIGCDPTVVRLITLLLVLFGGASIWIYIILWIVMPAALTARQKLEMRGEPITVTSIKDLYDTVATPEKRKTIIEKIITTIGRIIMMIFKIIMVCILAALFFSLLAVIIGVFVIVVLSGDIGEWSQIAIALFTLATVALFLIVSIYLLWQLVNSKQVKGRFIFAAFITWLLLSLTIAITLRSQDVSIKDKLLLEKATVLEYLEYLE